MKRSFALALALGVLLPAPRPARADPVYAIVIGVNRPLDPKTRMLQYADDDAILFHLLLAQIGRSVLLVDPDAGTRRLYGALAGARPPTRANVWSAVTGVLAEVQAARARGERPQLYFIYSGHGEVKNNEGYLALADDRLTSSDLSELLLARSAAESNHVIIDACKSYFMVHEKRAGGARQRLDRPFARSSDLARRFPNTGFLLSTSSAASSHEWEEFQAGIFSHEVRSGLLGAADVDRDGRVSYNEIRAFIAVANAAIKNDRFRPQIYFRPPRNDGSRPILGVRPSGAAAITIPPGRAGRYFVEDSQGVRLADLHTDRASSITLALLADRRVYMHDLGRSREYVVDPRPGRRPIAALASRPATYRPKGAAHEAFGQIFQEPFGRYAYCQMMRQYAREDPSLVGPECVECECRACSEPPPPSWAPPPPWPPSPPPATAVRTVQPEADRFFWERIVGVTLGTSFMKRSFDFHDPLDPENPPNYLSPFVVALTLGAEVYPLASLHRAPVANLGLEGRLDYVLDLKTMLPGFSQEPRDTTWYTWELGARYRWNITGRLNGPILKAGLGGGRAVFAVDWGDLANSHPLPDITYQFVKLTFFDLEVPFFQSWQFGIGLHANLHYLYVLNAGEIEHGDTRGYGQSTTQGVELGGGLFVRLRWVFFRLDGAYRRFAFDFDNRCYMERLGCKAAGGAVETNAGINLLAGFNY